jgi:hypothetical protein
MGSPRGVTGIDIDFSTRAVKGCATFMHPSKPNKEAKAFCQGCNGCPYRTTGCELQELRMKEEASQKGNRPRAN